MKNLHKNPKTKVISKILEFCEMDVGEELRLALIEAAIKSGKFEPEEQELDFDNLDYHAQVEIVYECLYTLWKEGKETNDPMKYAAHELLLTILGMILVQDLGII